MDTHGNTARWIRATTEKLGELAEQYDEVGMLAERDEINDVREALGALHRLPDPVDDEDEDDDDGYAERDVVQEQELSPDPGWMNP